MFVENAHSDDITGLTFSSDGRILLSRSFDGSLKVFSAILFLCYILLILDVTILLPMQITKCSLGLGSSEIERASSDV